MSRPDELASPDELTSPDEQVSEGGSIVGSEPDFGGDLLGPAQLDRLEAQIDAWLAGHLAENPAVTAVDRGEPGERRWYVRLAGEQKTTFTVWFTLGQRTLHYETYVMPAPIENHVAFYEHLLRRNLKLYGAAFAVGAEDAIFLIGQVAVETLDEAELDRVLGSLYAWVEQFFGPAMRIGYASVFKG